MSIARQLIWSIGFAAALLFGGLSAAQANTVAFEDIDGTGQGVPFADQVSMNVITSGSMIGFELLNSAAGATDGVIAQVNFHDSLNLLASFDSFTNIVGGVNFIEDNKNLSQGNTIGFVSDFGTTAAAPPPKNGVQPGDSITFLFNVATGVGLTDIMSALNSGALMVGMHVIAFADGSSDSLVSTTPVPIPASGLLILCGLGALAATRRRRT